MTNIFVIKFASSNWCSVLASLKKCGFTPMALELNDLLDIEDRSIVIIPGVGNIKSLSLEVANSVGIAQLRSYLMAKNHYVVGICLGFQFLCEASEEDESSICLSLLPLTVRSIFKPDSRPSVGWILR